MPNQTKGARGPHRMDTARRLFIRKVSGEALVIRNVGTSKIRGMAWAGDNYVLLSVTATLKFMRRPDNKWGQENLGEILQLDVVNTEKNLIYQAFQKDVSDVFPFGPPFNTALEDGRWVDFVEAFDSGRGERIERIDLETGKYSPVPGYDLNKFDTFIDATGKVTARAKYDEYKRQWTLLAGGRGADTVAVRKSNWDSVRDCFKSHSKNALKSIGSLEVRMS